LTPSNRSSRRTKVCAIATWTNAAGFSGYPAAMIPYSIPSSTNAAMVWSTSSMRWTMIVTR
jgi:hypothetical protein